MCMYIYINTFIQNVEYIVFKTVLKTELVPGNCDYDTDKQQLLCGFDRRHQLRSLVSSPAALTCILAVDLTGSPQL